MKIVFNTNQYIGGGETFVSEFVSRRTDYMIICSKNSWLSQNVNRKQILFTEIHSPLNILGGFNKKRLSRRLKNVIVREVLFLNFEDFETYNILFDSKVTINYYCLHPYDFYYRSARPKHSLFWELISKNRSPAFGRRAKLNYELLNNRINGTIFFMDEINLDLHRNYITVKSEVFPLPCVPERSFSDRFRGGKKIIWIGRFIDFKIRSLNSIIDFVASNPEYSLTVVGGGDYSHRISRNIENERIKVLGKVDYKLLPSLIEDHHIGYAMGVSSVLIASFSIPTIVAATDYPHWNNKIECKCLGLISDLRIGDFGTEIYLGESSLKSLADVLMDIEYNYNDIKKNCYLKSREFRLSRIYDFLT